MTRLLLILAVAVALSGCAEVQPVDIGPYPNNKAIMKEYIKNTFFDPYSLRDVSISETEEGVIGWNKGWLFCLECNAKNRMGGYIGLNRSAYLIQAEKVVMTESNSRYCYLPTTVMVPWPEMEGK